MKTDKSPTAKSKNKSKARATTPGDIMFYRANEKPYGAFSNLYKCPVEFEDRIYPTAEHAYQAGKALKPAVREWILQAPTPALAAMAAHGLYTWDVVPNWTNIKVDRMRAVLRAKFTQHLALRQLLLDTECRRLVEAGTVNTAVNRFWGEVKGKGQNMLGKLLMEIREELKGEKASPQEGRRETKKSRNKKRSVEELTAF